MTRKAPPHRGRLIAAYAVMVVGGIIVFLLVRGYGETLLAPARVGDAAAGRASASSAPDALFHVLLALATVLAVGRILGRLFAAIGQPPVVAEVIAGVLLGPSLLGRVAPAVSEYILPPSSAPLLSVIAQFGVILYMFLVGLNLNADLLRGRVHTMVATSHASIAAPFLLGLVLALYLYPRLSTSDVPFTSFALFMGVAMSITAFPVLARILTDRGISGTELGVLALTCAAVNDVTAWGLLALAIGVVQARPQSAALVAILTLTFVGVMFLIVRPIVIRLLRGGNRPVTRESIVFALLALLLAALTTEAIGIHPIFGAFLLGAIVPSDSLLARALDERLHDLVTILLLPAFFAFTGMRTRVDLVSGAGDWLTLAFVVLVATTGTFGGTTMAGRLGGMRWRDAATLGVLLNTRGLMEIIVLNIGLDLRVISPTLFTMLVLMALSTTMATAPVLRLFGSGAVPRTELQSTEATGRR